MHFLNTLCRGTPRATPQANVSLLTMKPLLKWARHFWSCSSPPTLSAQYTSAMLPCLLTATVSHLIFRCWLFQAKTKTSVNRPCRQKWHMFLHLPCQAWLVEPTSGATLQLGDMIKAIHPAKHIVYFELYYCPACLLSPPCLPDSSRSLPWAFSGGICWQGTACVDLTAAQGSHLLQS